MQEHRQPLILVADDQPGVRRLLAEILSDGPFRVAQAANGREALSLAAVERPALVLLDIKMPIMDGMKTLRVLRSLYPDLQVYMMTAVGDGETVDAALAAGASGCIAKPFDVFELRALVAAQVGKVGDG